MKRFVFVYGFNKNHELRDVKFMIDGDIRIKQIIKIVGTMMYKNPDIVDIYAMDGSFELRDAYKELCKEQCKDFTKIFEFWDYVSRTGLKLK